MTKEELLKMPLHKTIKVDGSQLPNFIWVIRVVGGWVYIYGNAAHGVFVPEPLEEIHQDQTFEAIEGFRVSKGTENGQAIRRDDIKERIIRETAAMGLAISGDDIQSLIADMDDGGLAEKYVRRELSLIDVVTLIDERDGEISDVINLILTHKSPDRLY